MDEQNTVIPPAPRTTPTSRLTNNNANTKLPGGKDLGTSLMHLDLYSISRCQHDRQSLFQRINHIQRLNLIVPLQQTCNHKRDIVDSVLLYTQLASPSHPIKEITPKKQLPYEEIKKEKNTYDQDKPSAPH